VIFWMRAREHGRLVNIGVTLVDGAISSVLFPRTLQLHTTQFFANFTQRRHEPDGTIYCILGDMPSVLFPRQKSAEGVFKENSNGQEA